MKLKPLFLAMLLAGAATPPVLASTQVTATPSSANVSQQQQKPFLGVSLAAVPEVVSANLPTSVVQGQGVMVVAVTPGSPAEKAGIKPYDVLLQFADQKLFSPQQLSSLVQTSSAGDAVTLRYVHRGEVKHTELQLGEQDAAASSLADNVRHWWHQHAPAMPDWRHWFSSAPTPQAWQTPAPAVHGHAMERFDSLSISMENGQYQVEMAYTDADGNEHSYHYKGSRDEIKAHIGSDDSLPEQKRAELLQALDMNLDSQLSQMMPPFAFPDRFSGHWR